MFMNMAATKTTLIATFGLRGDRLTRLLNAVDVRGVPDPRQKYASLRVAPLVTIKR
jgi:hypothetical protein